RAPWRSPSRDRGRRLAGQRPVVVDVSGRVSARRPCAPVTRGTAAVRAARPPATGACGPAAHGPAGPPPRGAPPPPPRGRAGGAGGAGTPGVSGPPPAPAARLRTAAARPGRPGPHRPRTGRRTPGYTAPCPRPPGGSGSCPPARLARQGGGLSVAAGARAAATRGTARAR